MSRAIAKNVGRPYHKDDNAPIEQKNWTHIRQWFGYERYDNPAVVSLLNELSGGPWRQRLNFFCPTLKLESKQRVGSRLQRVYGAVQTPYRRLLEHPEVTKKTKSELRQQRAKLNPFALNREIEESLKAIFAAARLRH